MDLANRITELRKKKGWTSNRLANESGLSQSFIWNLEKGNTQINIENLGYICDAFGITLSEFFAEDIDDNNIDEELQRTTSTLSTAGKKALIQFIKASKQTIS